MLNTNNLLITIVACICTASIAVGAESEPESHVHSHEQAMDDHSQHQDVSAKPAESFQGESLQQLMTLPASGKAREAGFDGKMVMESTGEPRSNDTLCIQGSRGLVALDRETWKKCSGKKTQPPNKKSNGG